LEQAANGTKARGILSEVAARLEPAPFVPRLTRFDLTQTPKARPMLVRNLIPARGVVAVTAETGACKSMLTQDLSRAVAQRGEWIGSAVNPSRAGDVLILDAENDSDSVTLTRFKAFLPALDDTTMGAIHYFPSHELGGAQLDDWVQEVEHHLTTVRPALVILDAVFSAGPGHESGNNDSVTPFMRALKRLADTHNCVICFIHHHKKPQVGASQQARHQASGAAQYINQSDVHLALRVVEQTATPQVDGSRHLQTVVRVEETKNRSSIGDGRIVAAVEAVESPANEDGERTLSNLVVRALDADEAAPITDGVYGKVLAALREAAPEGLLRRDLIAKGIASPTSVDNALVRGVEHGSIEHVGKGTPYRAVDHDDDQPPI
jgi:hypothetical protein